jgi:predicted ATPase/class 3 adenylate cyclase
MICSHCHSECAQDAVFCDECGAPLDAICPYCHESNRPSAKFCKKCGERLEAEPASISETTSEPAFGKTVVPKHLAEKILASRRFIEGERKQVTVLFADIRGSTSLIEKLDPEEVRKHFDPILHVMMDAVHRYEGTVNQVLGDGIMALFGAPLAHEDHAVRACYAALAMQDGMRRYADKLTAKHDALKIGIGINSGEVVVRSITNDLNIDYAALGHTTHLAARMEELAGGGSIMLTADTLREVEGFVEVHPLGALQVKGFSSSVEVFELVGATGARNRLQAAAARGLSTFVGRRAEIDAFQRFTAQADSGRGQVLALVGEAGMGKSRLVREFIQQYLPSGWKVMEASSVSYGKATPFFPVTEMLRNYFQISIGEESPSIQAKIVAQMLDLDGGLCDATPPILALMDVMPQVETRNLDDGRRHLDGHPRVVEAIAVFNSLEPQAKRSQIFQALRHLLLRESERQPLLVVFEDLHWIDSETQSFLDVLVECLPLAQIYLLVNYRPGYTHTWASKDYYDRVRVDPLSSAGANELVESLLGNHEDLTSLKELLIKRTEGNPFFVEEIVRSLAETGVLIGTRGAYRAGATVESIRIPSTVRTVLADRVDRLPSVEKQLLQTAAVIGVIVPFNLLRTVTGLPETQLSEYIADLQASEFLYESNLFPELEYTFKHALTNEVVYNALLHERRTALHANIVDALEEMARDNPAEHYEALAHHAFQSELWEKAVRYLQRAGAKAMSRSAFLEAAADCERALAALTHLPESQERLVQQIDLHLEARNVLFLLGDSARVSEHLHSAETLVQTLGDEQRTARVLNFLNGYYGLAGDPERAIEIGRRTLALTATGNDPALGAVAQYYTGVAYKQMGQYGPAIEILRRGIRSVDGDLRHERFGTAAVLSVTCRSHLVQCLAAIGQFSEGVCHAEEGIRIAEEANHAVGLIHILCSLGVLHLTKGDLDRAISTLERGLDICRSANIPVYVPLVSSRLGLAYANSGRISEAIPYLERGVEDFASAGRVAFLSLSIIWLSEGYLLSGRVEEAHAQAQRALDLSRKHREQGHAAWGLKLLGDIALRHDPLEAAEAETCYRQALAVSEELGVRPLQAHCYFGLGHVHAALGSLDQARRELSAAVDLYRSMDMTNWMPRVESALRNLST